MNADHLMSMINERGGGCFGPESTVTVVKNGQKITTLVKNLKKDDQLATATAATAKLVCLAKIMKTNPRKLAVLEGGLQITPTHPIRIDDQWKLPKDVAISFTENTSGELYCFVLEPPVPALVNGVECVTWGHGIQDKIVQHNYYGSKLIINDLMKLEGWSDGFV